MMVGEKSGNNFMGYNFNYKKYYRWKNLFMSVHLSVCLTERDSYKIDEFHRYCPQLFKLVVIPNAREGQKKIAAILTSGKEGRRLYPKPG